MKFVKIYRIFIVAFLYYILGKLAFLLSVKHGIVTNVPFFAEGVSLAFTILYGNLMAIGVFTGQFALAINSGMDFYSIIGISLLNSSLAILGRTIFTKLNLSKDLTRIRDVVFLTFIIVLIIQPLSAAGGNIILSINNHIKTNEIINSVFAWWFGNVIGQLVLTPFIILLISSKLTIKTFIFRDLLPGIITFIFVGIIFELTGYSADNYKFLILLLLYPATIIFVSRYKLFTVLFCLFILIIASFIMQAFGGVAISAQSSFTDFMQLDILLIGLLISAIILSVFIENFKQTQFELKQKEKQLTELNATKDKFFSIIAHDLKNPFHSIIGLIQLLDYNIDEQNFAKCKEIIRFVNASANSTYKLLENLLQWAQTQTGRIKFNPEFYDIKTIILNVIEATESNCFSKQIKITYQIQTEEKIFADKNMIETVLRNLVVNAIKYSYTNSEIKIICSLQNNFHKFEIIDSGIGMTDDILHKLFKITEKTSTPGTAKETGSGLGLIICNELIKRHNGQIWAETKLNEGSKFILILPPKTINKPA